MQHLQKAGFADSSFAKNLCNPLPPTISEKLYDHLQFALTAHK
jgi:hypothetical protein